MIATAILKKLKTDDGLVEMNDNISIGKEYKVVLTTKRTVTLQHISGTYHKKEIVLDVEGGWLFTEMLDIRYDAVLFNARMKTYFVVREDYSREPSDPIEVKLVNTLNENTLALVICSDYFSRFEIGELEVEPFEHLRQINGEGFALFRVYEVLDIKKRLLSKDLMQ